MLRFGTDLAGFLFVTVVIVFVLVYFPASAYATLASVTGYSQYTGEGFSLQYPADWTIQQNDMAGYSGGPVGEGIIVFNSQFPEFAIVFLAPTDVEEVENMTQADIDSRLEQIFPTFLKGIISEIKRGTLTELEKPIYDKYVVDGHNAGSAIYTATYEGIPFRGLVIGTIVGQNSFALAYGAPETVFDQSLPNAENMIKSIKFLQPFTATNNVQNQSDNIVIPANASISESNNTRNITEPVLLTYVDRANGINIQYPASWRISLLSYPGLVAFYAPLESLYDSLPALASISMTQYHNNISLSEYSNLTLTSISQLNSASNQSNQSVNIKSAGPIFISGYPAYKMMLSLAPNTNNPLGLEIMQAWTVVGNRVYIMSYTSEPSKFIEYLPDAESILRSFVISNPT